MCWIEDALFPVVCRLLFSYNRNMEKVAKSLAFFALLFVFFTRGTAPAFAEAKRAYFRPFDDVRQEMLEVDLASLGGSLSPYQLWLIHFWRWEYVWLLDADTFANAIESWKQRRSEVPVDLSGLFIDSRYYYFEGLVSRIRNTGLAPHEKDFLELFLTYILSQGEGIFSSGYELNVLAEAYLSKYPDSPYREFVESTIHADLPPILWYYGFSGLGLLVAAFPIGSIGDYFSGRMGFGFEIPIVSFRNIVLTPSFSIAWGSVQSSFSYGGKDWGGLWSVETRTLDLSLGYRFNLSPKFSILPQGGLGLLDVSEIAEGDERVFLSFIPTASLRMLFEYFYVGSAPGKIESSFSIAFGITYRRLIDPWEDRFDGSELFFELGLRYYSSR